ncbi:MAG: hypothetical protein JWO33_831, partial [Caulobacteraceae bacterium]|nr:hypothetical protein [Caulobacteraceae bacterium]
MQAADLLAIVVPGSPGQGGPGGLANGVGKAGLGQAGDRADASQEGQGADAANPFAQALAALMAAPGQAAPPVPTPTDGEEAAPEATTDTPNKGLQTALAATARAGAQANGLAKLLADTAAPEGDTPVTEGVKTKALPEQAKADETLADRLASPPPRSERAEAVA